MVPSLADEGALWFSNFLIPDPYIILPITVALLNLIITEVCYAIILIL